VGIPGHSILGFGYWTGTTPWHSTPTDFVVNWTTWGGGWDGMWGLVEFDEVYAYTTMRVDQQPQQGAITVTGTSGPGLVTVSSNPQEDVLLLEKEVYSLDPFDIEITVTGGQSQITIDETVLNLTGEDWLDFHYQLGFGLGDQFRPSDDTDGLSFLSGVSDVFGPGALLSQDELAFAGGVVPPGGIALFNLVIALPGEDPFTFTLREWPTTIIPEPATLLIWSLLGALALTLGLRRRGR
jgi:hypothetical protein